jgi:hypothetical protein
MSLTAGLDAMDKREIFPLVGIEPWPLGEQKLCS